MRCGLGLSSAADPHIGVHRNLGSNSGFKCVRGCSRNRVQCMGGERGIATFSDAAAAADAMGSQVELVRIRGTDLFLIDGEESVLMQSGDLVLVLQKQQRTPLAACVAMVGEVEWPVGKDAPVLRLADGRYSFALPGFAYGMVLPEGVPPELVRHLEQLLRVYATFEDEEPTGIDAQARAESQDDTALYWTAVAPEVERSSWRLARQIAAGSTATANSIVKSAEWAAMGIEKGGAFIKSHSTRRPSATAAADISPRMLKRVQQARRLSAVAKLFSRTLMKGAISATNHVANNLGAAVSSAPGGRSFQESGVRDVAVASVDAFGKVVEAVETAGKAVLETTASVGTDLVHHRFGEEAVPLAEDGFGTVGNVITTAWTLNKMGLRMLLRTLAASTAVNVVQQGPPRRVASEPVASASTSTAAPSGSQNAVFAEMSLSSPASGSQGRSSLASPAASTLSEQSTDSQVSVSLPAPPPPTSPPLRTSQFFPMVAGSGMSAASRAQDSSSFSTASPQLTPSLGSSFREYSRVPQPQDQSSFSFPWNPRLQGQR